MLTKIELNHDSLMDGFIINKQYFSSSDFLLLQLLD